MELSKRDKEIIVMCGRHHGFIFGNFLRLADGIDVDKSISTEMDVTIAMDFYVNMMEYMEKYKNTPEEQEFLAGALEEVEELCADPHRKEKLLREMIRIGIMVSMVKRRQQPGGVDIPKSEKSSGDSHEHIGYIQ